MARIDIRSNGGAALNDGVLQLENGVAMDTTLRNVADQNNTTSPLLLSTTAVQVESPLRITTSDASGFYLDAEDSATNNRFSIKRDPNSQEVTLDFASNPAGSTTLVGAIRTYQDGVNLSNAMSFIEDGSVGIGTNTPVGILHIKKTAANTRLAIDGDAGFNRLITYRTAGLQRFGLYVNNTAESGSNAGSNFAIRAYNDAGTLLHTPLSIERATGQVTFSERVNVEADSLVTTESCSVIAASTSNANLVIAPNGTGALVASIPDGTATGGNARGDNSVDLQTNRAAATNVASGNYSTISGGQSNTASSANSTVSGGQSNTASTGTHATVVGGSTNTSSGQYAVSGGFTNTASALGSVALGYASVASGAFSTALGLGNYATASRSTALGAGGNSYLTRGLSIGNSGSVSPFYGVIQQTLITPYSTAVLTTGATTVLSLDGSGTGDFVIPDGNNRAWNVQVRWVAVVTSLGSATGVTIGDTKTSTDLLAVVKRGGVTTVSAHTSAGTHAIETIAGSLTAANITYSAGASQQMQITFTGPTFAGGGSVTMRVVAAISLTEVAY